MSYPIKIYKVTYKIRAIENLREIYTYISEVLLSPTYAKDIIKDIGVRCSSLSTLPYRYPSVNIEFCPVIRKTTVKNYTIFYLIDEKKLAVDILLVKYSGSNFDDELEDSYKDLN